ncbi:hypothetical protein AAFF_G00411550 [Aldrovandia affinis]|uniref:KASH domain-containing protein n=1 Tax=Aldrovandia affinis TaxID=143900 RepID=A0AAD7SBU7_9TELE|nr:hypothetical protein AAFF_G00411550 [Aldrovandia affinis]
MESQVFLNGDFSIEEMIEKLNKAWQEEMTVVLENRKQLEQVGADLAQVSTASKASETWCHGDGTVECWQDLLDLNGTRVKRLQESLVAMNQLDRNMSSLQSWLAGVETELSHPITYHTCDSQEIQRKLSQQQDLQKDIEEHSTGMESVLSLCEAMLQDCDMCATDAEFNSIHQSTHNLDQRWRNVRKASTERRRWIEETGSLWERFLEDFSRFEDWLKVSERKAALSSSLGVLYTVAKEELKKFEVLEQQVQENVTQLHVIIKQYQRLAREDRTDESCQLRDMVDDGKQRWEDLNKTVAAILHRLKHFIGEREAFETTKDVVLMWVTAMDLQLTDTEHFSECALQDKLIQLQVFQQEISLNTDKIEHAVHQGELLIQKSEPLDAAVIEEELGELQRYCKEVFGHVDCYYDKLIGLLFIADEHYLSSPEEPEELSGLLWTGYVRDSVLAPPPSSMPVHTQDEDSRRGSPASVDSMPLEWDHEYDLSHAPAPFPDDAGTQDAHIQQLHQALHTSYLYLPDWSDFVSLTSSETETAGAVEQWELIPEQPLSEEFHVKHNLNQGQHLNSDLHSLWERLGLVEAELDRLRGRVLSSDSKVIKLHIRRLKQICVDLLESRLMVTSWLCPSGQSLTITDVSDCPEAKRTISDRLEWLLEEVTRVIRELEWALDITSGQECKRSPTQPGSSVSSSYPRSPKGVGSARSHPKGRHQPFLQRVLWAALPLQLILLFLLGLACLLPPTQEDYSYTLANILVQNLSPALHYTNGPPPV